MGQTQTKDALAKRAGTKLTRLGGPETGTVAALAVAQGRDTVLVFAGTPVGLFRSTGVAAGQVTGWQRLAQAPIGLVSVAASPTFAEDSTLVAGTNTGFYFSRDAGDTWQGAPSPFAGAVPVALAFSPNYARDGVLLAGTLEDGVFASDDRGASWQRKSFGLLDPTAYAVAFSPEYGHDETVFAGTDSTVYHSYNGARAWKVTGFPEEAAPVLSLAVAPDFGSSGTLYAGTESQGLFGSTDGGQTWARLDLPAACINALALTGEGALLAATEAGLWASADQGATWQAWLAQPNAISLAARADVVAAGLVDQGAWLRSEAGEWAPAPGFAARALVGLALSPQFERDRTAYLFGPRETPYRTTDGGATWAALPVDEPGTALRALALSPQFGRDRRLAAASERGVLLSTDGGDTWAVTAPRPAAQVAFAPDGRLLAAAFEPGGLGVSEDQGRTWRPVPGPWGGAGRALALAVDSGHQLHLAWLEGVGETLSVWQGKPGQFEQVLSVPAGPNPLAAFYLPGEAAPDRPWYAAVGNRVWKFSARRGRPPVETTVFEASPDRPGDQVLALAGAPTPAGHLLLASSGRQLYKSLDGGEWSVALDLEPDRALALAPSPAFAQDRAVYVLLLGGALAQAVLR